MSLCLLQGRKGSDSPPAKMSHSRPVSSELRHAVASEDGQRSSVSSMRQGKSTVNSPKAVTSSPPPTRTDESEKANRDSSGSPCKSLVASVRGERGDLQNCRPATTFFVASQHRQSSSRSAAAKTDSGTSPRIRTSRPGSKKNHLLDKHG